MVDEETIMDKIIESLDDPYLENDKYWIEHEPGLTISPWYWKLEDQKLLQKARNLFVKLKFDPASVPFAEELLDKRLLKKLKKSKYERDSELLKLIDLADNKDFLDDNKVPTRANYVETGWPCTFSKLQHRN